MSIPSPADAPTMSASELLAYIRSRGGRIYRYAEPPKVLVLTDDHGLFTWLVQHKAWAFAPPALEGQATAVDGSYLRDSVTGKREWDLSINSVPVNDVIEVGDPNYAIWKAAA